MPTNSLDLIAVRRSIIYKPLAILLAILLAPVISWMDPGARSGTRAFQARATSGCALFATAIIQNFCGTGGVLGAPINDIMQFESDSVNAYLAFHNLPSSDAHLIYDTARSDLRNAVRAVMVDSLIGIARTPASRHSDHEKALYKWLQAIVQQNELNLYTLANNEFQKFRGDACHFTLDPQIAAQYNLAFDGSSFCIAGTEASIFGPMIPSGSYFTTYGMRHSYGAWADTFPNFGQMVADTTASLGAQVGISLAGGALVGAAVAPAFYASFTAAAAAIGNGIVNSANGFLMSVPSVEAIGLGASVAAPVLIVVMSVAIGILAGMEVFQNDKTISDTAQQIAAGLNAATNTQIDLNSMATDSSGTGVFKITMSFVGLTLPEITNSTQLPTHTPNVDQNFAITIQENGLSEISDTLPYNDWNGRAWSAKTSGGWFVQSCTSQLTFICTQADSINADIRYVDWNGVNWTASRIGSHFVSTRSTVNNSLVACPADIVTLVYPGSDFSNCVAVASDTIKVMGGAYHQTISITNLSKPAFSSPTQFYFSPGTPSTQTITVSGSPAPTVCLNNTDLSPDFTLNGGACGTGTFQIAFNGNLAAAKTTYTLVLQAMNSSWPDEIAGTFTIKVQPELAIVSSSTITGTATIPMDFKIIATGNPTPRITFNPGSIPMSGLIFHDNGNGTADLQGIYSSPIDESCVTGCGITATNSQGSVVQPFTLAIASTPPAGMLPPASATFTAGAPNSVTLSSSGAITPVSWNYVPDLNAPWLVFVDNHDGTANLSGTPPAGTTGTFSPAIGPQAAGSLGINTRFPVTVVSTPVFLTANTATFTAGTPGSFSVQANSGTVSSTDSLPSGLSVAAGNPSVISGTPAAGTGGQYLVHMNVSDGTNAVTQVVTLNVNEAPRFQRPALVTLFSGVAASFNVTTTGFPIVSDHPIVTPSAPSSPSQGTGMFFTAAGLPTSLHASNLDAQGYATGSLTIQGTPTPGDAFTHKVQLTAQNAVGAAAQETLTLQVFPFNPSATVSIVPTAVFSRDANNNVLATVVIANTGNGAAQNVTITSVKIGAVAGSVVPVTIASLPSVSTATVSFVFPAGSLAASGTANVFTISGSYTGGTFSTGSRIVLP